MKVSRTPVLLVGLALAASLLVFVTPASSADSGPLPSFAVGELRPVDVERERQDDTKQPGGKRGKGGDQVPQTSPTAVANASSFGFLGLTHRDQRLANDGNQVSAEPPDQGLCAGGGEVIEAVNDVFATYDTNGHVISPSTPDSKGTSLSVFFTGQPEVVRDADGNIVSYGPFVTDPKCYFDPGTQRFFMSLANLDLDPQTGDFTGTAEQFIAVSKTSHPSASPGDWFIYVIDTTEPTHPGCGCFGDQPLIGADKYGFYVTTNEFSILGPEFNGARIYAFDKAALEKGTLRYQLVGGFPLALEEGLSASLQPATSPAARDWSDANGGTEYMLSTLDFDGTLDHRVAVWALTNTKSLTSPHPNVGLSEVTLTSEVYGVPPASDQKKGPTPLASSLMPKEREEKLDSNDDRMNQVVYAGGKLYGAIGTALKVGRNTEAGIAWLVVKPGGGRNLDASIQAQGYVGIDRNNVIYPSIAVNSAGKGLMTFSISGPDYFPSAGYTTFDANGPTSPVQIAAAGQLPDDGESGYKAFGGAGVGRWGDYTAAVPDASGNIWFADEFIPNAPRTELANWGTFVGRVTP